MSMTKTIEIDGQQVSFRASAAIPRIYRLRFHRDIYKDLAALEKAVSKGDSEESSLDMLSLEMFENIAYIMAKHADANIPDTPEDWLDGFSTFSPSIESDGQKAATTVEEALNVGIDNLIAGVHLRFTPENSKGEELTSRALKKECTFKAAYVISSKSKTIDGKKPAMV